MFYFPFEFTFLRGINTKHMMFFFGAICLLLDMLLVKKISFSKELLISSFIAIVFSLVGFYSTDYNVTSDYAYAAYIGSMWIWLLACYGACTSIRLTHGYISVKLIVNYLLIICVLQCIVALLIDFVPSVKSVVDAIFVTGDLRFMEKVKRLYGIGASLDVAGVRFSAVLVMAAVILSKDRILRSNTVHMTSYIFAFMIIGVMGNMLARTTSIGLLLGIAYIVFKSGLFSLFVRLVNFKLWKTLIASLAVFISIAVYLYKTSKQAFLLIRFAFEGFFNWVEQGEWETDSTEVLKEMWVFPSSTKTWVIGDGLFNNPWTGGFYMNTDVGYLRFIYYCGLIGLFFFSIFFIYLSYSLSRRFHYVRDIFLLLLIIVFANWIKVATDIFLVYAFFLVISQPYFANYYKKDFEAL